MSPDDPYAPPGAIVGDPVTAGRFRIGAVLLGILVDVGGTTLSSFVFAALVAFWVVRGGVPVSDIQTEIASRLLALQGSNAFLIASGAIGLGFTVLGGFVAGRIARHAEVRHALVMGMASLLLGASCHATSAAALPAWYWTLSHLLVLPAAALGGYWSRRRERAGG